MCRFPLLIKSRLNRTWNERHLRSPLLLDNRELAKRRGREHWAGEVFMWFNGTGERSARQVRYLDFGAAGGAEGEILRHGHARRHMYYHVGGAIHFGSSEALHGLNLQALAAIHLEQRAIVKDQPWLGEKAK